MAFNEYPKLPADVTNIGEDIYVGPNMDRNSVRLALQQLASDGRNLSDQSLKMADGLGLLVVGTINEGQVLSRVGGSLVGIPNDAGAIAEGIAAANAAANTSAGFAANSSASASASAASSVSASNFAIDAANSAINASGFAASASGFASASAVSAASSDAARISAENARDLALTAYDSFDDRYLGPKASDPTLDNDGNALLVGAMYFNTTLPVMKVYAGSGTGWINAPQGPPGDDGMGAGTVTSVSGNGTVSGLTLTGAVTTAGSLTLGGTLSVAGSNFGSQTANRVLAAPNGSAGNPSFRALVAADIPTLNQSTTGSAATLTNARTIGMTGDIVWSTPAFDGSANVTAASAIQAGVVSNAKLANVATATIKGRTTAGTGSPQDLTGTQATALLNTFTSTLKGLAPPSGGGTDNFLRADGSWAAPTVATSPMVGNAISGYIDLGGGFTFAWRNATQSGGASNQAYGAGKVYTTFAKAWVEGDDSMVDVSIVLTSTGLSTASVSNRGNLASFTIFSIGI